MFLSGDLAAADTLFIRGAMSRPERVIAAAFGRDGASLYLVSAAGNLSSLRRLDGYVLGQTAELANELVNSLTVLPDSRTLIATAASADGDRGALTFLDATTLHSEVVLHPCLGHPEGLVILRDLNRAYTRCVGNGEELADIDLDLRRVIETAPLQSGDQARLADPPCGAGGIALSRTGTVLLVPCSVSGMLLYLDRLELVPFDSVTVGTGVHHVAASPTESKAVVTYPQSRRVAFVDLRSRRVTTEIPVPGRPIQVAIGGDGKRAYVLTVGAPTDPEILTVLDMHGEQTVAQASVPSGSRTLSLWPGLWSPVMRWD